VEAQAVKGHGEGIGDRPARVGVVGCGNIAVPHVQTILRSGGETELHFHDLDPGAARALAEKTGARARVHEDVDSMLGGAGLDVVHVLTPPTSHLALARKALEAGAHVLVEKPMAMTSAETEELLDLAKERGRKICVNHSLLPMPCVREAVRLVRSGALGRVVTFDCFYGHGEKSGSIPYGGPRHWAYHIDGGVLLNLISHPASLLAEFLGPSRRIRTLRTSRNVMPGDMPDTVQVSTDSREGFGVFTISMSHGNAARQARIYCERGTIHIDLSRQVTVVDRHRGPLGPVQKIIGGVTLGLRQALGTVDVVYRVARGRLKSDPGLRSLVEEFHRAVRYGTEVPVSEENAREVARIVDAALMERREPAKEEVFA